MDRAAERPRPLTPCSVKVIEAIHIARLESGVSLGEHYIFDDGLLRVLLSCGAVYFTNHWGMVLIDDERLLAWAGAVRCGVDPLEAAGLCCGEWEAACPSTT